MLELNNIDKSYRKKSVLAGLTHQFPIGVTVITGPSGAGKSTLLRLCATAEKPSAGTITWKGKSIVGGKKHFRKTLGYAPQRIDFPEDITAIDFLCHIGALKYISRSDAARQGQAILERIGLGADANQRIQTYSGGMRRRLGLAQAFLGAPECLILDEPTAELDAVTAGYVNDLVFETAQSATVLMTTHLEGSLSSYPYQNFVINPIAA